MNTVTIMQPTYLPWLGLIDMIDQSDLFILLDTVPVNAKSWQTRNRLINTQGHETWLSIPVHAHQGQLLHDVRIAEDGKWRRKHQRTIQALAKDDSLNPLLGLYETHWDFLTEFTAAALLEICLALGISTPIIPASVYTLPVRANPIDRIADLCERVGADELLDAAGAKDVLSLDWLPLGGNPRWIPVRYHDYLPQEYQQVGADFKPYMSVVDCLARHGSERTLEVVRAGRQTRLVA